LLPRLKNWYFNLYLPALSLKQQGKLRKGEIDDDVLDINLDQE